VRLRTDTSFILEPPASHSNIAAAVAAAVDAGVDEAGADALDGDVNVGDGLDGIDDELPLSRLSSAS